jgi:hypothetical protein
MATKKVHLRLTLDIDDALKARPIYLELGGFPFTALGPRTRTSSR